MVHADRCASFRKLHERGTFVIPNPWDIGTARFLKTLGFSALATTSAGFGFTRGLPDSAAVLPLEAVLGHVAEIVQATDLPVNADFQSGYADTPECVAANVTCCIETGIAGLSIEDATGDPARPLYDFHEAVERFQAARAAVDAANRRLQTDVLLTARSECFLVGHSDPLNESIRRLRAFAEAGADVLFAPGAMTRETIQAIVAAAEGRPVNVLVTANTGLTVADLAALGVRRVSLGSALARTAWGGFIRAAEQLAQAGSFEGLEGAATFARLNGLFAEWRGA